MDTGLAMAFWGVSMLFVLTPGVDWAYAISSGRHRGGVLPAVSGMLAGHLTATLIVAAGVAAIITAYDMAMTVLTLAGAAYLIWLGTSALRDHTTSDPGAERAPAGPGGLFAKGIGISLLNPKVFLLFLALLPQFTSATTTWPVGAQMAVLGAIHVANCAVVYNAVGYGAATVFRNRPRVAKIISITSGVVMITLGVALAAEKLLEQ